MLNVKYSKVEDATAEYEYLVVNYVKSKMLNTKKNEKYEAQTQKRRARYSRYSR